ncbi:hypothetical protein ACFL0X_00510 [Nanoarchaeota archaeon]
MKKRKTNGRVRNLLLACGAAAILTGCAEDGRSTAINCGALVELTTPSCQAEEKPFTQWKTNKRQIVIDPHGSLSDNGRAYVIQDLVYDSGTDVFGTHKKNTYATEDFGDIDGIRICKAEGALAFPYHETDGMTCERATFRSDLDTSLVLKRMERIFKESPYNRPCEEGEEPESVTIQMNHEPCRIDAPKSTLKTR